MLMDELKISQSSSENRTLPPKPNLPFWKGGLYTRLMVSVFSMVFAIEAVILLPVYHQYKKSQLQHVERDGLKVVQGMITLQSGNFSVPEHISELPEPIHGLAFYNKDGDQAGVLGEEQTFPERWDGILIQPKDDNLHWIYWERRDLGGAYHVVALLEKKGLHDQALRNLIPVFGIALAISLLITTAIMLFLKNRIIKPLRQLQSKLASSDHDSPSSKGSGGLKQIIDHVDGLLNAYQQSSELLQEKKKQLRATNLVLEMQVAEKHTLEKSNQLKTRFLADVAQKMKVAMDEFMKTVAPGVDIGNTESFQAIRGNGHHLLEILNDLMDLSRLKAGIANYSPEETDLGGLIREVERPLQQALSEKSLKITKEFMTRQLIVTCDRDKIRRVFINIMDNAIRFSPERGEIKIGFRRYYDDRDDEWISCTFHDQGPGIPETELDSVFNQYVQQSKAVNDDVSTGMGLAICKEIIEAHGGTIGVENSSEGGALLIVNLPMKSGLDL